jgi:hypothetical protein
VRKPEWVPEIEGETIIASRFLTLLIASCQGGTEEAIEESGEIFLRVYWYYLPSELDKKLRDAQIEIGIPWHVRQSPGECTLALNNEQGIIRPSLSCHLVQNDGASTTRVFHPLRLNDERGVNNTCFSQLAGSRSQ